MLTRLNRPIMVHLCKDRTLSYRKRSEPVFNGAALPVFSVESEEEAQDLIVLIGTAVHGEHPLLPPGRPWYKLFNGIADNKPSLELADLEEAEAYIAEAYEALMARRKAA